MSTSVARCITFEGWSEVIALVYAASPGYTVEVTIFFVTLVVLGGFYLVKLFLAVISNVYTRTHLRESANKMADSATADSATASSATTDNANGDDSAATSPLPPLPPSKTTCVERLRCLVEHRAFQTLSLLVIMLNTVLMMCNGYPIDPALSRQLESANTLFTYMYTAELSLKLLAYGLADDGGLSLRAFWAEAYSRLDVIIVLSSLADVLFAASSLDASFLRALRLLRVLRIFRLFRSWHSLAGLFRVFANIATNGAAWAFCLLALVLFIAALLGMQLFGGIYHGHPGFPQGPPRHNFDSLPSAMLTAFSISTLEDWDLVWYDTQRASGPLVILYFFLLILVSRYLVLNLLAAMVFSGFDSYQQAVKTPQPQPQEPQEPPSSNGPLLFDSSTADVTPTSDPRQPTPWSYLSLSAFLEAERQGYALGCLAHDHWLRASCRALLEWKVPSVGVASFENIIIALIVLSSVVMAIDDCSVVPGSPLHVTLERINVLTLSIFCVELLARVCVHGLLYGNGSTTVPFLTSPWNLLDAIVVLASLASSLNSAFRALRVLRVLRPLRLVARLPGLKLVVECFLRALPRMMDVLVIYILLLLITSILAVELFAGMLRSCGDGDSDGVGIGRVTFQTRQACEAAGLEWSNPRFGSFDNVGAAAQLLFEMATLEGWTHVMYASIDASSVEHAPVRDYAPIRSLFFVGWILLAGFMLLDLFIGELTPPHLRTPHLFSPAPIPTRPSLLSSPFMQAPSSLCTPRSKPSKTAPHS